VTEPLKIDVWSDIACPWCYIGKRRLEAGIAAYLAAGPDRPPVDVEYHSFQLSPDTPVAFEGNVVDYLVGAKRLSEAQVQSMLDRVTAIAREDGLTYDFGRVRHTNTVKAHELLHYAKARGRQLDMKERLLKAYFIDGRHVGRIEDLADIAAEIGLDRADVVRALTENEYLADVKADVAQANAYGIQGVPFFVIDGKYGVSGAQDATTFTEVLEKVRAERGSSVTDSAGGPLLIQLGNADAGYCEGDSCIVPPAVDPNYSGSLMSATVAPNAEIMASASTKAV
jgi:predicted DsbA family dithiol-disulfide isomerase